MLTVLYGLFLVPALLDEAALLSRAESAFKKGVDLLDKPNEAKPHFRQAAADFEELQRRGFNGAELQLNLGNAHLLAGELPRAILAYRRGLLHSPSNSLLRANLAYARTCVNLPPTSDVGRASSDPWWMMAMHQAAPPCLVMTILAYGTGWLSLTRWAMTRQGFWLGLSGTGFLAAILTFSVAAVSWVAQKAEQRRNWEQPLVILSRDGIQLRKGNGPDYPPRLDTLLPAGVEARLLHDKGNWLQIELASGEVGWVSSADVLIDAP